MKRADIAATLIITCNWKHLFGEGLLTFEEPSATTMLVQQFKKDAKQNRKYRMSRTSRLQLINRTFKVGPSLPGSTTPEVQRPWLGCSPVGESQPQIHSRFGTRFVRLTIFAFFSTVSGIFSACVITIWHLVVQNTAHMGRYRHLYTLLGVRSNI